MIHELEPVPFIETEMAYQVDISGLVPGGKYKVMVAAWQNTSGEYAVSEVTETDGTISKIFYHSLPFFMKFCWCLELHLLAHLYKSTESYCCHFDVGVSRGVTLSSLRQSFFYVMGKALSGELSCMGTGLVLSSSFQHFKVHVYGYTALSFSHICKEEHSL